MKISELKKHNLNEEQKIGFIMNNVKDIAKEDRRNFPKADCAIVLGCSPIPLKDRMLKAIQLYNLGFNDKILLSGGYGYHVLEKENNIKNIKKVLKPFIDIEVDEELYDLTEAELCYKILYNNSDSFKIPKRDLLFDVYSNNSGENAKYSKYVIDFFQREENKKIKRCIIITSAFHIKRALLTFKKIFPEIEFIGAPATNDLKRNNVYLETICDDKYYRKQIIDEYDRIIKYVEKEILFDERVHERLESELKQIKR